MLTIKFYGSEILRFLRTKRLEVKWSQFHSQPTAEKSFFEGAVLISQWMQIRRERAPNLRQVESLIRDFVDRVTQQLGHCTQQSTPAKVLSSINQLLFEEMGFHFRGNNNCQSSDYYFIDKVAI